MEGREKLNVFMDNTFLELKGYSLSSFWRHSWLFKSRRVRSRTHFRRTSSNRPCSLYAFSIPPSNNNIEDIRYTIRLTITFPFQILRHHHTLATAAQPKRDWEHHPRILCKTSKALSAHKLHAREWRRLSWNRAVDLHPHRRNMKQKRKLLSEIKLSQSLKLCSSQKPICLL